MENQLVSWIVSLITGGVGGNIAGALLKNLSLGVLGNTIAGLLGGGFGRSDNRRPVGRGGEFRIAG